MRHHQGAQEMLQSGGRCEMLQPLETIILGLGWLRKTYKALGVDLIILLIGYYLLGKNC